MKLSKSFTLFLLVLCVAGLARAGFIIRTGADRIGLTADAAWFTGEDRSIRWCAEVSPEFPLVKDQIPALVEDVFANWRAYMDRKGVSGLAMKLVLSECDGAEDLKFYFGGTNDQVKAAIAKYENPLSLAERSAYDIEAGWGKGFIWVSAEKEWLAPGRLFGVLSHEIGHVLGCDHVSGTIMTADVERLLFESNLQGADYFRNIDFRTELVACRDCSVSYEGGIGLADSGLYALKAQAIFERFTGRAPKGAVKATLTGNAWRTPEDSRALQLRLSDELGAKVVPIELITNLAVANAAKGAEAFKIVRRDAAQGLMMSSRAKYSGMAYGRASDAKGNEVSLVLEYNVNDAGAKRGFMNLLVFGRDAEMETLFRMSYPKLVGPESSDRWTW